MTAQDQFRDRRLAMRLSLLVGFGMLAGKLAAYHLTNSAAILSDAAESVIHVAAVAFAAFSLRLSSRPADGDSPYGYERMTFFSAGFEGGAITVAAFWIIYAAIEKWRAGLVLEQIGLGALLTLAASLVNLALGWYLIRTGRRTRSLILEANGKHVLTDSWTSFGVVAGLILVLITGWKPFDPLVAIAVALNILWTGAGLIRTAVRGLLDLPDQAQRAEIEQLVSTLGREMGMRHHRLRFRDTGSRVIVSLHLLFPASETIGSVHRRATLFEQAMEARAPFPLEVISHLESIEDHEDLHPNEKPDFTP
ncbi:MAG: cation diffusion facilitator family transporter [Bryobacteraceae bacterium]